MNIDFFQQVTQASWLALSYWRGMGEAAIIKKMLKHDIGFFKASDSIHLNPYESQLSSASDKYNPSYPRLLMLNLGKYSADAPLHNRANDINLTTLNIEF